MLGDCVFLTTGLSLGDCSGTSANDGISVYSGFSVGAEVLETGDEASDVSGLLEVSLEGTGDGAIVVPETTATDGDSVNAILGLLDDIPALEIVEALTGALNSDELSPPFRLLAVTPMDTLTTTMSAKDASIASFLFDHIAIGSLSAFLSLKESI